MYGTLVNIDPRAAVWVRDLVRGYGRTPVLRGVSLTVQEGTIYALLGPSGTGKTTLLNILCGQLRPAAGDVRVLGGRPGLDRCGVPGEAVGLMPQDLALYKDLTIGELLRMHARIHGVVGPEYQSRQQHLLDFLELPGESRLVSNLSGGQQRRVSLAVALVHRPRLLLLDEPTVGADPVLRHRIWEYLTALTKEGTTVVITTHYIEEARGADCLGLMRNGRILAEGPPDYILRRTDCSSLEAAFLRLCQQADESLCEQAVVDAAPWNEPTFNRLRWRVRTDSVLALAGRTLNRYRRNLAFLAFVFLLPTIQVCLFCVAIGRTPTDLPFGYVNSDVPAPSPVNSSHTLTLGADFIRILGSDAAVDLQQLASVSEGVSAVEHGKLWGFVEVPQNFSHDLPLRLVGMAFPDRLTPELRNGSTLAMTLDMSHIQTAAVLENATMTAFQDLLKDMLLDNHTRSNKTAVPSWATDYPVQLMRPLYGPKDPQFTDFVAPGIIITIAFAQSIGLTALAFVFEKRDGTLNRLWAAGLSPIEVLLGQIGAQMLVLLVQVALMLVIALVVFDVPIRGSLFLAVLLVLLMGLVGMLYGLIIAAVSSDEIKAAQGAMGSLFPAMLLSGVIWPAESIPQPLRWVTVCLPTTWAAEAMRSVCLRGWDVTSQSVALGFILPAGWCVLFIVLGTALVRNRT
eukprot:TRINITY_DN10850_c0_g1_i1.p1 TRINITY_DN10850_c0_g1~~TRINITY_DN10850_c0_g1_i1.p1  ORF type:complete len:684 (+),score=68.76 TRINITY_DN10850_c0_g1_i1:433-2484(+)